MSEAVDDSSGGICDACLEFHTNLGNLENHLQSVTEGYEGHELPIIDKNQLPVFYQYLGVWLQR